MKLISRGFPQPILSQFRPLNHQHSFLTTITNLDNKNSLTKEQMKEEEDVGKNIEKKYEYIVKPSVLIY